MTSEIWSGAHRRRGCSRRSIVISEPSAASTRLLPAGVSSVSSTGRASSSEAELRATSPRAADPGQQQPGQQRPGDDDRRGELGEQVRVRDCAFSDIGAEDTCPAAPSAEVRRGARAAPGCAACRSACPRRAGEFLGHDAQPVEVVHVARGGGHGADGDLRVGAGEPVGQVLLAGGLDHPLGVHPQRRGGDVGALGRRPRSTSSAAPSARVADSAVVAGGWVRLSTSPASGMPSADSRSTK